ncbi:MAG: outer membrane protein assembly factor BamA [Spirochaetales bacterium]|nr:outer membrane protein assembly factor BamA [Spirochaetales bacterium]MBP5756015.1 outer membrane protein assembly factor BamA [Spirochaetales bacterium]
MNRKLILIMILVFSVLFSAFAADEWYYDKEIAEFSISGLKNVSESEINKVLYPYRYKAFTDELFSQMMEELYKVNGIDFFTADAEKNEAGELKIVFEFFEVPKLNAIRYEGNSKIKARDLREAVTEISVGMFLDPAKKASFELAKAQIESLYYSKGFLSIPIEYEITKNDEANTFDVVFKITEGDQTRITKILFSGNEHFDESTLRKQMSTKVKSLFNTGYLNMEKLRADIGALVSYYQTNGYIDVIVSDPVIEYVESDTTKYKQAIVTYTIIEGKQWFYGGLEVSGNTIFSDEQIKKVQRLKVGSVLNIAQVQNEYSSIADLYYNDGYIANGMNMRDERDDTNMTVKFYLDIVEGPQATVEEILISGLDRTKDYVMRRELEIHPGDIFSKAKLITSAQNLYNTGLLENLDYDLMYGQEENTVILDFKLKEGRTKDIQFGATFGGTLNSFPVSAFVQWTDHNLGGRGQELGFGLTLSPDTQSINIKFGDNWFKNYRWSNSFNFGFSHSSYSDELQKGIGAPKYYDGRNSNETWPLGYESATQWIKANNEYPSSRYLMKYDLYTFSLGYNTGYTFIYDVGRLSLFGGVNVSLNKAFYDTRFTPFEKLIYQYSLRWQFSNKLNFGIQWDGRDYITNTTKGYVLSTSFTYAGGLLGGLSNYNKISASAAGYLKLFSFQTKEEKTKNIMLCASTSLNFMLPQFYNYNKVYDDDESKGLGFWDPKLGATRYEMLYIDGMTIGRGFSSVVDQAFLWDNMLEVSYQLVENILQAELFVSATGVNSELTEIKNGINWYFAAGGGIKLKISGFPLGLYLVKNATYKFQNVGDTERSFKWQGGNYFHGNSDTSGMSLVLAISTSLI